MPVSSYTWIVALSASIRITLSDEPIVAHAHLRRQRGLFGSCGVPART